MGLVIGLCGKAGSGKTEVRRILEKKFHFEVVHSKSLLYSMSAEVTGLPEHHFWHPDYKNGFFEDQPLRKITGELGNVVEGLFGDDYLIRCALDKHNVRVRPNTNFVIDSLRKTQPVLLKDDILILEVIAKRSLDTGNIFDNYTLPTKQRFPLYQVVNDGTLTELEGEVTKLIRNLKTMGALDYLV